MRNYKEVQKEMFKQDNELRIMALKDAFMDIRISLTTILRVIQSYF